MEIILLVIILILLIAIALLIIFKSRGSNSDAVINSIAGLQSNLQKIESNFKEDFKINREENSGIAKDNREELNNTLKIITGQNQMH